MDGVTVRDAQSARFLFVRRARRPERREMIN